MAIHNGHAYYTMSITQTDKDASAQSIASDMIPALKGMMTGDNKFKVIAMTCDNATVNAATYRLLIQEFDWLIHIGRTDLNRRLSTTEPRTLSLTHCQNRVT